MTEKLKSLCRFETGHISFGFAQAAAYNFLAKENDNDFKEILDCISNNDLENLNAARNNV